VLFAGHVIRERWVPGGPAVDLPALLGQLVASQDYLVAGYPIGDEASGQGLASRCLLVDLARYSAMECPPYGTAGR
jgi:hypothetical protein